MAVGHLGILNIGPHLLLQILRQRIHVFQIYRVSRGVNGRRGIIQQHVPVFLRQVLRLSYTYLKNTHDAQDICQTVFVKLLMEPREFKSPEHERAYILRMAANACKDLLKSPWRQRSQSLDVGLEVPAPQAGDGSVLEAVNQLPPHYRAVIYLFYYEGYQAAEIGQILGIPTATVHTRLARGRTKLKELLGGYGYEQLV